MKFGFVIIAKVGAGYKTSISVYTVETDIANSAIGLYAIAWLPSRGPCWAFDGASLVYTTVDGVIEIVITAFPMN